MGNTIVIADAHLEEVGSELDIFLAFLADLRNRHIQTLYLLGDLFNIWLGSPQMQLRHQRLVTDELETLRATQIVLKYVEGNRDYFLTSSYLNTPFHEIATGFLEEQIGENKLYFSHGDLVNIHDRQYRLWRSLSRNHLIFSAFQRLPQSLAIRFVHFLEQTFRGTNQRHKMRFPQELCAEYADYLWKSGYDTIMLGHFHEQHHLESAYETRPRHLYSLPAWKDTHVYASIDERGAVSFQQFEA